MKNYLLSFVLLMSSYIVFSQTDSTKNADDELLLGDSGPIQSTSLLPEGMGLIKRTLWSENGWMRHTNYFKLTPENREREIQIRRKMLVAHQFLGMVTLGTMVGSAITGQVMISTQSGRTQENVKPFHKAFITSTMITYTTTALLQMLAPPPIIIRKNKGWSNVKAHRTLAYLHFTGMVLTPIAGRLMYGSASLQNDKSDQLRKFHQVAGYFTTGLFAGAVLVMKF